MADGRHLEKKSKNGLISATVWPIDTTFATALHIRHTFRTVLAVKMHSVARTDTMTASTALV